MKNNKNLLVWVVVIVVAVIFIRMAFKQGAAPTTEGGITQESANEDSSTPAVATSTRSATPAPAVAEPLTYAQALEQYATKRIQFNSQCQVSQNSSTYKNNTKVMLDNRASVDRVVKIGPMTMTLKAYGFKIITLSSNTLPATWRIDCGNLKNIATILIQK